MRRRRPRALLEDDREASVAALPRHPSSRRARSSERPPASRQTTCTPASSAATACSACTPGGVHTCSTSMPPSASRSSSEAKVAGPPQRSANARASSGSRSTTATSCASVVAASASACALAMAPVPTIAARSGVCSGMGLLGEVGADCGVGAVGAESAAHAEGVGGRDAATRASASPGSPPASSASSRRPVSWAAASAPPCHRSRHSGARGATSATARSCSRASRSASSSSASRWPASTAPSPKSARKPSTARSRRASAAAGVPRRVGRRRGGSPRPGSAPGRRATSAGNVMTASPASGSPAFCMTTTHLEVAAVVDRAVDHARAEPHDRAGLERMLREARSRRRSAARPRPAMTTYASVDTVCRCGVPPASPSGAPPVVDLEQLTEVPPGNAGPLTPPHGSPSSAGSASGAGRGEVGRTRRSLAPSAITTAYRNRTVSPAATGDLLAEERRRVQAGELLGAGEPLRRDAAGCRGRRPSRRRGRAGAVVPPAKPIHAARGCRGARRRPRRRARAGRRR